MDLKALIVDDEANSRAILRNYLTKYCKNVIIEGEAGSVQETMDLLKNHQPDVIFLDVEMPYGTAFDFLEKVPDRNFETVFVTAYDHYAIEALNAQATYYLLKPIAIEKLMDAVAHVVYIKEKEKDLSENLLEPKNFIDDGKITIPIQDGFEVLETKNILYCQADDNYTKIFLKEGTRLVSKTLKHFEDLLVSYGFVRIHKSFLINANQVQKYRKGKGGSVELTNGKQLMVSSSKKAALLNCFK